MPIYEYQCSSCHHHFDLMQKFNDPPITQCPQCGQPTVIKLISAAGFQLKGTGWYVTDFKDKPKTTDSKPIAAPAKDLKESSPAASSTETKPQKNSGDAS